MAKDANGWPVRKSTNPTIGGKRCHCGDVLTIHMAKGKRKAFLYTMCSSCGTDQRTGKTVQTKWAQHFATMDELLASELAEQARNESTPEPEKEPEAGPEPQLMPKETEPEPQPKPEEKPNMWRAILTGVILGGLTGGVITRIS